MARKLNEVVSVLKDAIAKIENKNPLQQPSTSSGPSDILTECFSDADDTNCHDRFGPQSDAIGWRVKCLVFLLLRRQNNSKGSWMPDFPGNKTFLLNPDTLTSF